MSDWMHRLRRHYDRARERRPEHELLLLFDIDGTIVDMRRMVHHVLRAYDEHHGTRHFADLAPADVEVHENQVEELPRLGELPPEERERVRHWYLSRRWQPEAIFASHRPFEGAMEVIRWFQLQPRTTVALNTGRPESLRAETRFLLNALGEEWRVEFPDELLFMNDGGWEQDVVHSKVEGVRHFQRLGYHVCAFVDNEPSNLEAVAEAEGTDDLLLLHADTLFESRRERLPRDSVSGRSWRVALLATEDRLPRHVRYTWQAVDDRRSLRRFLSSRVRWAELDVRPGPRGLPPVVRAEPLAARRAEREERMMTLTEMLRIVYGRGRAAKLHLHGGEELVERVAELAQEVGIASDTVGFRVDPASAGEEAVRRLARAFPLAWLEAPAGELAEAMVHRPQEATARLERWRELGIRTLSVPHDLPFLGSMLARIRDRGFAVDVQGAGDVETFLRGVLLLPDSVTVRFGAAGWARGTRSGASAA